MIIHLPEGKDVVVDAKMSLVSYEQYFNSEEPHEQQQALKPCGIYPQSHAYAKPQGLPSVTGNSFIRLRFNVIPIEPAYLLALKAPELDEGIKQNIMLVCPSTLLVAVRTINNIWRYERQGQMPRRYRAAKMYDKLRLFVDDMQVLGTSLDKANNTYLSAMKRLAEGREI